MKHAKWEADEVAVRMRHDFAQAMTELDELEATIREHLDALDLLGV